VDQSRCESTTPIQSDRNAVLQRVTIGMVDRTGGLPNVMANPIDKPLQGLAFQRNRGWRSRPNSQPALLSGCVNQSSPLLNALQVQLVSLH
jgi:hypothetical protein